MGQPVGKRRIENDLQPIFREEPAIDDLVPDRSLHPAVGGKNPERGGQRAHRHQQGGDEMHGRRHQLAAEQQHPEEGRLQEECGQALIGQERRDHVAGVVGKAAPVGAELERHDHAGHHPHAEGDREDPQPELGESEPDRPPGQGVAAFQKGDE
jgi:hypothetical protein